MKPYRFAPMCLIFAALSALAPQASADAGGRWQSSQEAYAKVCAYCHETGVGPLITGRSLPPEYIRAVVRGGNRAMPAFRPTELDDQTLAAVARLVAQSRSSTQ